MIPQTLLGWVPWAVVGAAAIHIVEEYRAGLIRWFPEHSDLQITVREFVIINVAFVALCIAAAVIGPAAPILVLSVAALVFINAWLHLIAALRVRRYVPGLISAVVLYLPLGAAAFVLAWRTGRLAAPSALTAVVLGAAWQAVPIAFHAVYQSVTQRSAPPSP